MEAGWSLNLMLCLKKEIVLPVLQIGNLKFLYSFFYFFSQDRLDWATFRNTLEASNLYQNQIKSQAIKEKNWKHKADQPFYSAFFSWFVWLWS